MARLTAAQRKAAPHAGPGNSFPIPDKAHARLALAMAGHAADPAAVRAKVHARYPDIHISGTAPKPTHSSKG